ncbi:Hypothetical protein Minf_1920 [Methylacidiphilum infernorum V4]|uniref:Uncharacterized protein n=1 Tax=Methylacidiphilum infernorum (isolate V4) TaxID=481448 RepID=B3DY22_METI4|nr:Hypothetical protein Minf_1920 [Methylacidiphilum infernorum V4]
MHFASFKCFLVCREFEIKKVANSIHFAKKSFFYSSLYKGKSGKATALFKVSKKLRKEWKTKAEQKKIKLKYS